jgi:hypothetical protein
LNHRLFGIFWATASRRGHPLPRSSHRFLVALALAIPAVLGFRPAGRVATSHDPFLSARLFARYKAGCFRCQRVAS